ncbi:heat shock transcription factor-like isoform X3 [Tachysurus fulvidraco]|uniref:heat shock transcription factor-like isoform X3 n=1 Tax=Tachysurus fulvidraco TaxID=1234273 RepID=UPI001FED4C4A|nr:heat shock transcription factor-like isoform X3 [Tachysurus fulvidraco]
MSGNVDSTLEAEISAGMEVQINRRNFPINLWNLVNDPQICSICWDDSGEGILICPESFKAEVLSKANKEKIFRTTNFISFVRQLNLYGFRKVCPDYKISLKQVGFIQHFYNPNFKRANPELLAKLQRLTPSNRAKLTTGQDVSNHPSTFHPVLNSPDISAVVGNHSCIPGALDPNMPCSQQEVASSTHCGYYPNHLLSRTHLATSSTLARILTVNQLMSRTHLATSSTLARIQTVNQLMSRTTHLATSSTLARILTGNQLMSRTTHLATSSTLARIQTVNQLMSRTTHLATFCTLARIQTVNQLMSRTTHLATSSTLARIQTGNQLMSRTTHLATFCTLARIQIPGRVT